MNYGLLCCTAGLTYNEAWVHEQVVQKKYMGVERAIPCRAHIREHHLRREASTLLQLNRLSTMKESLHVVEHPMKTVSACNSGPLHWTICYDSKYMGMSSQGGLIIVVMYEISIIHSMWNGRLDFFHTT